MKKFIPSICAVVLLAGCSSEDQRVGVVNPLPRVYRGRVVTYGIDRGSSMGDQIDMINAERAMALRGFALQRPHDATVESRTISISRPPQMDYPGSVTSVPPPTSSVLTPPEPLSPPARPSSPQPVAEPPPHNAPMAVPVPGKPGYVLSPFSPKSGYVDVTGIPPGTEAKDPYTGKVFRVP